MRSIPKPKKMLIVCVFCGAKFAATRRPRIGDVEVCTSCELDRSITKKEVAQTIGDHRILQKLR